MKLRTLEILVGPIDPFFKLISRFEMGQILHKPPNVPTKMINYSYLSSSILIPLDSENRAAFVAVYTDNVGSGHSVQ